MLSLSKEWIKYLISKPETGMGYQVVSITLKDGRKFDRVVIDSGYLVRIKDVEGIPFSVDDIQEIIITHDKWDFNAERRQAKA